MTWYSLLQMQMVVFMPINHKHFVLLSFTTIMFADCLSISSPLAQGECYEKEGNANLAQAAYERAIIEDQENTQARLKLAAYYNNLKMHKQANALLKNINRTQLTPAQRTALSTLKEQDAPLSHFRAKTTLGLGYDSNINISPQIDNLPASLEPETATLFTRVKADLSYLHDLTSRGGWFLRTDANIYYQNNNDAHTYDALYGRVFAGGGYYGKGYSLYLPLYYDRLNYLDRDLLQESGLKPSINVELPNNFITNVTTSYGIRRYIQDQDQLRDDDIVRASLALIWLEGKDMAYIRGRYELYTARYDNAYTFTNKQMYYAQIGGIYAVANIFDVRVNYQYRYGDFEKAQDLKRDDQNHDAKVALERDLIANLRMSIHYRYLHNESNYDLATYTKHETMLGLTYVY